MNTQETAITVYDSIQDPLEFVEKMGTIFSQSGLAGVKNQAEGKVLALACVAKKMDPFDIDKTYHIIKGKLTMRADAMLAALLSKGGKFKWLRQGENGTAELEIDYGGQTMSTTYSMQDAERAKLVKKDSGWEKNPDAMLRARVTSKLMRMIAPDIVAGVYTPEEVESLEDPKPPRKRRSKKEVEERKQEIAEDEPQLDDEDSNVIEGEVVETEVVETEEETQDTPNTEEVTAVDYDAAIISLETLLKTCDATLEKYEAKLQLKNPEFSLKNLDGNQVAQLEKNLRAKLDAKK